ncbi:UDP-N-acetylmuramoyl-L-alanine--D-glutamate ligase [Actinophytocola gossypii]|uniref:UDP-N-acetylmuramoylalanine--D-glutamate ligase n=1 Tax=Actinophytocola gossypii TaxID=2812003 RepID=A0ABT2JBI1_9PSEU|nr:UDP-N-acetylmuramoyl-L-alanine--D-glutamate ligase [Actinophytocola gossypii]MCT2585227.1 UDP-N-acetylmuramoyl-L-alanine--D-glutamate ligase [Actinophytocola gossypii]
MTDRVLVAGAGVTGRSVVDALVELGARVTVTVPESAAGQLAGFPDGVATEAGLAAPPAGTDLVVTSPGIPPTNPLLAAAAAAGIEVIGEVELAWRIAAAKPAPPTWLAITGTDGKTTTVGMLEAILRAAGIDAVACGNVGLPVVDAVRAGHPVLAVELSSYQLHWQSSLRAGAAVVLNVADDHLDWHGGVEPYVEAKARIYTGARLAVHNADDPVSTRLAASRPNRVSFTLGAPAPGQYGVADGWLVHGDLRLLPAAEVRPAGPHNVANALAAAALARAAGVSPEHVRAGLNAYEPPEHRVQLVADIGGVRWINDSKATNTHAAHGSLTAFEHVVWIAGGLLHGAPVDALVAEVAPRLRGTVLIGADQDAFAAALARHAPDVPVHRVRSGDDEPMISAVRAAGAMAGHGDVVLLAPAAKSHDQFASYVHRGTAFTEAVHATAGAVAEPGRGG